MQQLKAHFSKINVPQSAIWPLPCDYPTFTKISPTRFLIAGGSDSTLYRECYEYNHETQSCKLLPPMYVQKKKQTKFNKNLNLCLNLSIGQRVYLGILLFFAITSSLFLVVKIICPRNSHNGPVLVTFTSTISSLKSGHS